MSLHNELKSDASKIACARSAVQLCFTSSICKNHSQSVSSRSSMWTKWASNSDSTAEGLVQGPSMPSHRNPLMICSDVNDTKLTMPASRSTFCSLSSANSPDSPTLAVRAHCNQMFRWHTICSMSCQTRTIDNLFTSVNASAVLTVGSASSAPVARAWCRQVWSRSARGAEVEVAACPARSASTSTCRDQHGAGPLDMVTFIL